MWTWGGGAERCQRQDASMSAPVLPLDTPTAHPLPERSTQPFTCKAHPLRSEFPASSREGFRPRGRALDPLSLGRLSSSLSLSWPSCGVESKASLAPLF